MTTISFVVLKVFCLAFLLSQARLGYRSCQAKYKHNIFTMCPTWLGVCLEQRFMLGFKTCDSVKL